MHSLEFASAAPTDLHLRELLASAPADMHSHDFASAPTDLQIVNGARPLILRRKTSHYIMCSGPFRGASGTQQFARLHRKGPHRLGAWRSGTLSKSCRLRAICHKLCGIRAFCVTQCTKHRHQSIREIPTGVPFPQVLDSHRC